MPVGWEPYGIGIFVVDPVRSLPKICISKRFPVALDVQTTREKAGAPPKPYLNAFEKEVFAYIGSVRFLARLEG